jgi:hypothetical protein
MGKRDLPAYRVILARLTNDTEATQSNVVHVFWSLMSGPGSHMRNSDAALRAAAAAESQSHFGRGEAVD